MGTSNNLNIGSESIVVKKRRYKKESLLLGKLFAKLYPELAKELISTYMLPEPDLDDLNEIPALFDLFCSINSLKPENIKGYLKKPRAVDNRKLFVSTILRLYNPQVYKQPIDSIVLKNRLNSYLSSFLMIHRSHVSLTIRDCIMEEKIYVEYKAKVDELVNNIKSQYLNNKN